ncbi:unnamed protein product [Rhodiola kirilowii]
MSIKLLTHTSFKLSYLSIMDSNNFGGFSNSWSYGSDVKSEESISNKNRDYTSEFTTNQIFENREDMLNWAKRIGLENGIVVVIKNSAKK